MATIGRIENEQHGGLVYIKAILILIITYKDTTGLDIIL